MKYKLTVTTIKRRDPNSKKPDSYLYTVTDETGKLISTRKSDRKYVACTANGSHYFGRLDLIGKGDHGRALRHYEQVGEVEEYHGKMFPTNREKNLADLRAIAYIE